MRKFTSQFFHLALLLALSVLPVQVTQADSGFPDRLQILSLLAKQDYDGLEQLLGGLQRAAEKDIAKEDSVRFGFETFMTTKPDIESQLRKWAEARPRSYCAQLAIGAYFQNLGMKRRGGELAYKTSKEQFSQMAAAFEQAVPHLKTALSLNPRLSVAYWISISIAMAQSDTDAEQALVRKGLEEFPASFSIRRAYMQTLLPRWGGSYAQMKQFADQSQAYAAQSPKLKILRGLVAWDKGSIALLEKDYSKSVAFFTEALKSGEYATFFENRSSAYYELKAYDKALQDAESALRLYPQTSGILVNKAYALGALDRTDEAYVALEQAAAVDPDALNWQNAADWITNKLGHEAYELEKKGHIDEAITSLDKAVKLNPKSPQPFYWRGRMRIKAKQFEQAKGDFEEAMRLDPAFFDAAQNLDWLYARDNRWDEVVELWNRFLVANPAKAEAYLERAGTFRRKGNMPAALRDLKKACDLGNGQACQYYNQQAGQGAVSPWQ